MALQRNDIILVTTWLRIIIVRFNASGPPLAKKTTADFCDRRNWCSAIVSGFRNAPLPRFLESSCFKSLNDIVNLIAIISVHLVLFKYAIK